MAAPKENLLSLGQLTGKERNTFTKPRRHGLKNSVNRPQLLQADFSTPQTHQQLRAMHLQQHWQDLKERELRAQQHNRQLLQQFEEAQGTLREMLALTAAMKTIRMEYEQFLEENSPRWQQQLKEKTAAAQKKRMEEYLKSCPKNTAERVTSSADGPLLSHGSATMAQKIAAPPKHYSPNSHLDYNQHGSPHLSYMQSSWLIHPQSQIARFPIRAPYQPQGSSPVPPSFLPPNTFPYAHSLPLQHLTSTTGDHHPRPRHNPPGWASLQPDYPWSWAPGPTGISSASEAPWGQLYMEEPPLEMGLAQVEADTGRAPSSKRERGGGGRSSHLSQELDIKPVRLSGGLAESSGSSRESSQESREKRKKREERGRSHCSSSDRESCSSQESSRCSNSIAAVTVAQSSKSEASSVKSRSGKSGRTRSGGLAVGSPRAEKVAKESKGDDPGSHKEESQSTSEELKSLIGESRSEKAENQSPDDKSESFGEESGADREEESGRVSVKTANCSGDEIQKVESSSSEQSSVGEKDEDDVADGEDDGGAEEKENNQTDEEQEESHVKGDDEPSERKNTTDEEETGAEDEAMEQESEVKGDREEQSDRLKNEDGENGKKDSSSSKEEEEADESEGDESDEEEQRHLAGEPDEERDSDSIISPQDRSARMHIIPKDASEEDEEENESEGDEDNMEEEESDGLKNEDGENGNKGSSSSQEEEEEDESEGDEDNMEDEESDEEEQRGDLAGKPDEERDSDNSIISPQDRSKRMHIIPEEASEDEEESKRGSSGDDSHEFSDEDDAEHLLALHDQTQKKEVKDLKADEEPKAICDNVEIFQVETDKSTKSDHPSDSDEFDNFYG